MFLAAFAVRAQFLPFDSGVRREEHPVSNAIVSTDNELQVSVQSLHVYPVKSCAGISLRGLSASVIGKKYVLILGFDSADAAANAAKAVRAA